MRAEPEATPKVEEQKKPMRRSAAGRGAPVPKSARAPQGTVKERDVKDKDKGKEQGKPSAFSQRSESVKKTFRDTRSELAKITWPDQETTRNLTGLVIALAVILGLALGAIDFLFLKLLEAL